MRRLEGHRMLITGGARGIGAATAARAIAEGATVALLDRDAATVTTTAAAIGAVALVADVRDGAAVEAAVAEAVARLGGLDDVFANAGIGNMKPLHTYTDAEWRLIIDVNLTGTFNILRAVAPRLVAASGGSIVTCASAAALRPTRGEGPYCAAKAGVIALSAGAALEYAPTVRVNCVSPGFVATDLTAGILAEEAQRDEVESGTPLGRVGTAEDVAAAVVYLCSDDAAWTTGQNLVIDGGALLPSPQVDPIIDRLLG